MRIGIVTFWQSNDNYGQLLQGFAFQQYLKQLGHNPFIVRYNFDGRKIHTPLWKLILKHLLIFPILKMQKINDIQLEIGIKNKNRHFDQFRQEFINLSPEEYNSIESLRLNPPVADCYIAGSDQVWGPLLDNEENKTFFLDFGSKKTIRISYAASFGREYYPKEYKGGLKNQLQKFDAVSVRESDGVNICNELGIEAHHVLDPTLLLCRSDYIRLIHPVEHKDFVYVYSLNIADPREIRWCELQTYVKSQNLNIVITSSSGNIHCNEIFGNDKVYDYATIEKWLSNVYYSRMIITTSFHGVVFAIILQRNFIYVPLRGRFRHGNNRALELLTKLGLQSRVLTKDVPISFFFEKITDWNEIQIKLNVLKDKSYYFLKNYLKRASCPYYN